MAMSNAEKQPQEIIFDILTRLPAKCIGQFRCVSKGWCSLLSDPHFVKAHLKFYAHKKEEKLLFFSDSLQTITFTHNPHNRTTDAISRKLNFPQISDYWSGVVGSCNGLVLVINWEEVKYLINPTTVKFREEVKYLINPTTLKYHRIPVFDLALRGCCWSRVCFTTDDYKVVTLSRYQGPSFSTSVDVYSVRTGLWRRLESFLLSYLYLVFLLVPLRFCASMND